MPYVLQPADFRVVQTVFRSIVDSEWFDRTPDNEKACTQLLLVWYKDGMSADDLRGKCIEIIRDLFSKRQPPATISRGAEGT